MDDRQPPLNELVPPGAGSNAQPVIREFDLSELMHGDKEIHIRHAGEIYRLRLTKNDKLILQK